MNTKPRAFARIAIVNRGEPAMRLIHAVREWNGERRQRLQTIALYTEPDRDALYVREADTSFLLGPAMFLDAADPDEEGRPRRKSCYLDYARLREALASTRADAAWVGWGFVAEHAAFAELCAELGVAFIGPTPDAMRRLGDKIGSKLLAEQAGVPVASWSGGPVASLAAAQDHAQRIGYPLLIKATAGGGGRGIRFVHSDAELPEAFGAAAAEARKAFGDGTVFLEARVGAARHIEVQILADAHGTVWPVGVRDCSAQRNNQKVIEEAPSPVLEPEQEDALKQAAVKLARAAGYVNAGTVEFLFEPKTGRFYFMEMNTRLQVEHPVTEATTGLDLVRLQLAIAQGEALAPEPPPTRGHSIEVRLCAEDPDRGFAPSPGKVLDFRTPIGPGVRTDAGVRAGDRIPVEFDSMVAKLIAHGATREEARARLTRALHDTLLVIEGGTSNRSFLLRLLEHPDFVRADIDTRWIDRLMQQESATGPNAAAALMATAIERHERQLEEDKLNFLAAAARGRPALPPRRHRSIELRFGGNTYEFHVATLEPGYYRLKVDGQAVDVRYERDSQYEGRLCYETDDGLRRHRIVGVASGMDHLVDADGATYRISRDAGGLLRAPAPGLVLSLYVAEGTQVRQGDRLLSLEAMKMEMPVTATFNGRVRKVLVSQSAQVAAGDPLVIVEPDVEQRGAAQQSTRVSLPATSGDTGHDRAAGLRLVRRELRRLMLGFDIADDRVDALLARFAEACTSLPANDPPRPELDMIREVLSLYLEVETLFSKQYSEASSTLPRLSHERCLHMYLREFRSEGRGLPSAFLAALGAAVAHYRVASLSDSHRLRDALVRLYYSHANVAQKNRVVVALLQRCLESPALQAAARSPEVRELLDRFLALTQEPYPNVCETAQQARYALFEGWERAERRREDLARVDAVLETLHADPERHDRPALMAEIVEAQLAFNDHLAGRLRTADTATRALALEVMTRRLYRSRTPGRPRVLDVDGRPHLVLPGEGEEPTIVVTYAGLSDIEATVGCLERAVARLEPGRRVLVDLYVDVERAADEEGDARLLAGKLARLAASAGIGRVCAALIHPAGPLGYYTFTTGGGELAEDENLRGFHPARADRLELWRLQHFRVRRVANSGDLYLFHAQARQNERDERFFAIAEVRQMRVVRDRAGRLVALPELEHTALEAFDAIREQQARRDARQRLHWNRVTLFAQAPLLAKREDLYEIGRKLQPATTGLGLEKVSVRVRWHEDPAEAPRDVVIGLSDRTGHRLELTVSEPHNEPLRVLDDYALKVIRARQRRITYVYEAVKMLAPSEAGPDAPTGEFDEHDLEPGGSGNRLVSVKGRPFGKNTANVVVGVIKNFTAKHPEGMTRVIVLGDGTREMGALAEPECRRIIGALDLAREMRVPLEWFPVSSGAKIAMDSGTENLDWTAAVLRRIIEFTQAGGEINIVVDGINVGAQSYWNAEATMLMHTRGCLIMTPRGSMLLTGKRALDYSGGISAEDNLGIGGFERIMGPNGEAQYHAHDLAEACRILLRYYEHTYVAPGERGPRRRPSTDPTSRDVCLAPYPGGEAFAAIGELWSDEKNPGRKKPFDIRALLQAVADGDAQPLERWAGQRDAEMAVVWDAHLGGHPVCLIGIESKPLVRAGYVPSDGPDTWSGGTLFPVGSKKVARAINAASGNRPVVVVANLSGFDGSPESLRKMQLEYGAEIGRAVVNFKGPVVFCVVARYHGGAYVVFSKSLNPSLKALALSGSYASVIGGAPAAAVVFPEEARALTLKDPRIAELERRLRAAGVERPRLNPEYADLYTRVHIEKLREIAERFDGIHSVQRAKQVGSLDGVIEPAELRTALIDAVSRAHENGRARQGRAPRGGSKNGGKRRNPAPTESP